MHQDELVQNFNKVLENSNIKNVRIIWSNSEVYITTSLINYRILLDISAICVALYGTYTIKDKNFYLIPIIAFNSILLVAICMDFMPINRIRVDLFSKVIEKKNRNLLNRPFLRYILGRKNLYKFEEIKEIVVRSNESSNLDLLRYYIDLRLQNDRKCVLISFRKEAQANNVARFLSHLIKG